jgi:hypothetical protein
MFEKIKQRVKEGRWLITAWWIQPDCNVPSDESESVIISGSPANKTCKALSRGK